MGSPELRGVTTVPTAPVLQGATEGARPVVWYHTPGPRTYSTEVAGAWCSVKAQQQPGDGDHVILYEGLWGSRAM